MTEEPFEEGPDPDETVTDKELNQLIDDLLAQARPERYDADEKEWMESVVAPVRKELQRQKSADDVALDAAKRRVYQREGLATKRTNKILRDIAETGQLPIGWGEGDWLAFLFDILHLPMSIARRRVRFGAASAADLVAWELESAREQDKRNKAEAASREGARFLADMLDRQHAQRIEDLRPDGG